jgi:hypothetical protein
VISNDTYVSEPRASNLFMEMVHSYLWDGSGVARGKISDVRHKRNYCGLCPRVAAPCHKQNYTLDLSCGTLQLSRTALIVNVVSVAVL